MRGVALALLLAGCYWSKAPSLPYGQPTLDWHAVKPTPPLPAEAPALRSPRTLVLSRFATAITNPVGGLYDHTAQNETALWRTYTARDVATPIFEGLAGRLRQAGLRVLKDYTDHANVHLMEPPLKRLDPLVLTARLLEFRHDQVREGPSRDFEAAFASLDVSVRDTKRAARLFTHRANLLVKLPAGGLNVLQLLGARLADELASLPPFRAVLEGGGR